MPETITNITKSEPWAPQGTGLQYGYGKAKTIFDQQMAQPFSGFSPTSQAALAGIKATASGPNPFLASTTGAVNDVASGAQSIGTGGMFGDVYNEAQAPGRLYSGMFNDVATGGMVDSNPFRDAARDDALEQASNQIKASLSSAGRYGSGFGKEQMARGLGGVAADFNLAAYDADMNRMMQGAQAQSAEDLARQGISLSAAQGQTGVESDNIAARLGAAGMAPAMNDFRYADAGRLAGVGAAEDEMGEQARNRNWDLLNRYQGIFGSLPGSAGSVQTEEPDNSSSWLSALGGAGAGAAVGGSIFGPLGAGIGAGLGGLGSWLFG